ncbi:MAG: hypothetical protein V5A46_03310 [Haloferacaceae archaeon]
MEIGDADFDVPVWLVGLVLVAFVASVLYGVVITGSLLAPLVMWFYVVGLGLSAFVVYLLYRFVVAVERIADKI